MYYHQFEVRKTNIVLVGDEQGLSRLMIDNGTKPVVIDPTWELSEKPFREAQKQLREYFEGSRTSFDLKLNPNGSTFQKQAWEALMQIPYAELYSYKQVAALLGKPGASRAVGMANNRNPIPIIIPCHRVVGANKKLVGYAYGLALKQELIEREKINDAFGRMTRYYGNINRKAWGDRDSWWPASSAFEMMAGAILTQNTNWKNVEKALANLDNKCTPQFILQATNDDLAELIRASGYHNQKAKKLKALSSWFGKYDFDIHKASAVDGRLLRDELLSINGVGCETADSILVYALSKTSFVIDAYTRRIFFRLGIDVPKDYDMFREMMEKSVPKNISNYDYYHGLVLEHAKAFCNKTPKCKACPLENICEKKEVSNQIALDL
jgi:O-6-methylguanine DNA methyltransferase